MSLAADTPLPFLSPAPQYSPEGESKEGAGGARETVAMPLQQQQLQQQAALKRTVSWDKPRALSFADCGEETAKSVEAGKENVVM
jgi:hypothetical protein